MNKWLACMVLLNTGLVFICFGLMARANSCEKNLSEAFFAGGTLVLAVSVVVFVLAKR